MWRRADRACLARSAFTLRFNLIGPGLGTSILMPRPGGNHWQGPVDMGPDGLYAYENVSRAASCPAPPSFLLRRAGRAARALNRRPQQQQLTIAPLDTFSGAFFVYGLMDYTKLGGLIPAVIQDAATSEVLMVGFMNQEAFNRTRDTGFATFFSRSRNALWTKGETSGNRLKVERILVDCDDDTVLVKVTRLGDGDVCHTGERTCFFGALERRNGYEE